MSLALFTCFVTQGLKEARRIGENTDLVATTSNTFAATYVALVVMGVQPFVTEGALSAAILFIYFLKTYNTTVWIMCSGALEDTSLSYCNRLKLYLLTVIDPIDPSALPVIGQLFYTATRTEAAG